MISGSSSSTEGLDGQILKWRVYLTQRALANILQITACGFLNCYTMVKGIRFLALWEEMKTDGNGEHLAAFKTKVTKRIKNKREIVSTKGFIFETLHS